MGGGASLTNSREFEREVVNISFQFFLVEVIVIMFFVLFSSSFFIIFLVVLNLVIDMFFVENFLVFDDL